MPFGVGVEVEDVGRPDAQDEQPDYSTVPDGQIRYQALRLAPSATVDLWATTLDGLAVDDGDDRDVRHEIEVDRQIVVGEQP